jgi:hypothetical protein
MGFVSGHAFRYAARVWNFGIAALAAMQRLKLRRYFRLGGIADDALIRISPANALISQLGTSAHAPLE